jgi:hypothetical protein
MFPSNDSAALAPEGDSELTQNAHLETAHFHSMSLEAASCCSSKG